MRPEEAFETCRNSKYVLRLQWNVIYREKRKISLHFVRKTGVEASKFIKNSLKKILDYITCTFPRQQLFYM